VIRVIIYVLVVGLTLLGQVVCIVPPADIKTAMPEGFDKCVKAGGKVRTKTLKDGKYMHICYDKNGKSHAGEVKHNLKHKVLSK